VESTICFVRKGRVEGGGEEEKEERKGETWLYK
jgi:hypothetical protein